MTELTGTRVSKYVSAHCTQGACEGVKKLSPGGALYQACKGTYRYRAITIVCTHDCHELLRMMRELAGIKQTDNAAIVAARTAENLHVGGTMMASGVSFASDPMTDLSGAIMAVPTVATVRAALDEVARDVKPKTKSHLEDKVKEIVRRLLVGSAGRAMIEMGAIQPKMVSLSVSKDNPPSQGAIYAIFKRWESAGLVTLGTRPFRITSVTSLGERAFR